MDFEKLLRPIECTCGKTHTCDIKKVVIKPGATEELSALTEGWNNIVVIADTNTYAVCGDAVVSQLGDKLENKIVFECDGFLVPNEDAIEKAQAVLSDKTDLIIGIGAGVIQDLAKYVSFYAKLPYFIVATAPSMDGYASVGAAMITGNMKVTYSCHVPYAIIGDTEVLKNAPMDMIKSGYGDILGKFSCLNDWKLSTVVNDEYFCDYVYDLTYDMLIKTKDLGPKLLERDAEAVQTLMEALVGVGIAMALVGNSRPASGSEHHMSHYFEVVGIMRNEPYFHHGIDVVYSAVFVQKLREQILALDAPNAEAPFDRAKWENKIYGVYDAAAEGVIALQDKLGWYDNSRADIYADKWDSIKNILSEAPSSEEMLAYLDSIDLDINEYKDTYKAEKLQNAMWFSKDLKDRYTVLWLYFSLFYRW